MDNGISREEFDSLKAIINSIDERLKQVVQEGDQKKEEVAQEEAQKKEDEFRDRLNKIDGTLGKLLKQETEGGALIDGTVEVEEETPEDATEDIDPNETEEEKKKRLERLKAKTTSDYSGDAEAVSTKDEPGTGNKRFISSLEKRIARIEKGQANWKGSDKGDNLQKETSYLRNVLAAQYGFKSPGGGD